MEENTLTKISNTPRSEKGNKWKRRNLLTNHLKVLFDLSNFATHRPRWDQIAFYIWSAIWACASRGGTHDAWSLRYPQAVDSIVSKTPLCPARPQIERHWAFVYWIEIRLWWIGGGSSYNSHSHWWTPADPTTFASASLNFYFGEQGRIRWGGETI